MQKTNIGKAPQSLNHLVSTLEVVNSADSCLDQIHQIFDMYGLGHGCLHTFGKNYDPSSALWRVTPDDVTEACCYLIQENKHPAISLGIDRHFPFDLFDFRDSFSNDKDIEALFVAFENNGLNHAYGLPIQTMDHGNFVFIVGRPGSAIETVELLTLQTICTNAVNKVQQFKKIPSDAKLAKKLSSNERQMLLSIARGESKSIISDKLKISELTLNLMLKNIHKKLGAHNTSHAVILSLIEGEFDLKDCNSK